MDVRRLHMYGFVPGIDASRYAGIRERGRIREFERLGKILFAGNGRMGVIELLKHERVRDEQLSGQRQFFNGRVYGLGMACEYGE